MQIESLKVFCDLVESKSFTKAAEMNGVTLSAVSQQVHTLEEKFKSLLVERNNKKFGLTREGEVFYEFSRQIVNTFGKLQDALVATKNSISGTIRVATIYSIGLHDLPPCIKRFLKTYPTVNVHVEYRSAEDVYSQVLGNFADLGLVSYPTRDSRLEIVPLRKDALVLICHPQHQLARAGKTGLQMLEGQKFISFGPKIPTRKALDRVFKEHRVKVNRVMEFDNVEFVKRAVEVDAGIAIVPESTIGLELSEKALAAVKIENGDFYRPLAVIYEKNKILSPAMKQFIALLKETGN